MIWSWLQHT